MTSFSEAIERKSQPKAELLQPFSYAGLTLANRVVMSAMTRGRSPNGVPNDWNREYYAQRASAGLILSESTSISPRAISYLNNARIYNDEHVAGWKRITDAVHARGGHIFLQMMHCGHNSHRLLQPDGQLPFGPSAIPAPGMVRTPEGRVPLETPRALELSEVPELLDEYRQCAIRAQQAGFDGVEVHGGNGYLLDQFLRDSTNKRTDEYGGPPENRRRLLLEAVSAVLEVWDRKRVSVRISPTNPAGYDIWDSNPEALFTCVVDGLEQLGIGFLDVVEGATGRELDQCPFDFGRLRSRFSGVYIANNRYTFESGNRAIRVGHADLVAFGRPFVANPDLVERFAVGAPLNEINEATLRNTDSTGYIDYPTLGEDLVARQEHGRDKHREASDDPADSQPADS